MRTPVNILLTVFLVVSLIAPASLVAGERAADKVQPEQARQSALASGVGLTAPAYDVRVNVGGPAYLDTQGKTWLADQAYVPAAWGHVSGGTTYSVVTEIHDTNDDPLYQTQRSMSTNPVNLTRYLFDVQNGVYEVELRFAEIYCTVINCRTFHVRLEGIHEVLTNFDPLKVGGYSRPIHATFMVPVTDNQLEVRFVHGTGGGPILNAIRVTSVALADLPATVRLNAGEHDYRDTQGNWWLADQKYIAGTRGYVEPATGASAVDKTAQTIASTPEQKLLQTNRYNMAGYTINMPNGFYRVELHLAELYASINAVGSRVFDVWAEGSLALPNVDVFQRAGNKYRAITETFPINVLDGQLNITFTKKITSPNPAIVNAIAIFPLDTIAPGPWTNFSPTTWQTTQTPNVSVQVIDGLAGLNVASGQYAYSTNGGASFSAWLPAAVSGSNGTTSTQTVSVASVPFNQDSATQNRLKFRVNDMSSNIGESSVYTVSIDSRPPTSTITSPAPGTNTAQGVITVTGTVTDAVSGVQLVEVSTNLGLNWSPATGTSSWTYNWTVPGDGIYRIQSRARDAVGNVETPATGVLVIIDRVPPATFIRTPVNDQAITTTMYLITGTAFDATTGLRRVEVSTDGGANWITATGTTAWSYNWMPATQGNVSIRARAVDNAGNVDNPGTTVTVYVDRVAPTSSIVDPMPGRAIRGAQYAVSGLASDDGAGLALVEVSTDGVNWNPATGLSTWVYNWNPLPPDGAYSVRSRATDLAGLVQDPPASSNITVDNTPPTSTGSLLGTVGNAGWYISSVVFQLSSVDATSGVRATYYKIGAGSWMTYTSPVTLSTSGNHIVSFYAVDRAGNTEGEQSLNLWLDAAAPSTSLGLSGPAGDGGWYRGTVLATLSASDDASGVSTVRYALDGGAEQTYGGPVAISGEGQHTFNYRATDVAGNQETLRSANVGVDTVAPVSHASLIGSPGNAGWYVGPVTVLLGASDATSGVRATYYQINGSGYITAPPALNLTVNGQHFIEHYGVDRAGNVESTRNRTVSIDTFAPTTTHSLDGAVGAGGWHRSAVQVTLSSVDNASGVANIRYRVNGGTLETYGGPFTLAADGAYTVTYYAVDVAGKTESEKSFNVQIDSSPPNAAITSPQSGQVVNGDPLQIQGTAGDVGGSGLISVEISLDGGAWLPAAGGTSWSLMWTSPPPGVRNLRARATDGAGNQSTPGMGAYIIVDTSQPASTIQGPMSGQILRGPTAVISGTSSDTFSSVALVEVSTNGGASWQAAVLQPSGAWAYNWTIPNDGIFNIRSRATDRAGNVETPTSGVSVQVDSISPLSQIASPASGQYIRASLLVITGTASDVGSGVKRVEVSIDGGAWALATGVSPWQYVWSPVGGDGPHTLRSRATDNAGNVESPSAGVTITLDNGKPSSTIASPLNGQVITTPELTISGAASDAISPIKRVEITLQRGLDGYYWNGVEWAAAETWLLTDSVGGNWSYLWTDLPKVMMATIRSRATDNVGNVETPGAGVTVTVQRGFSVFMPVIINAFTP